MADSLGLDEGLSLSDYEFDLPATQIAAWPAQKRGEDRLLVLTRSSGDLTHLDFSQILDRLRPDDLLVFNDVRVRKARLSANKRPGGGRLEVLLLAPRDQSGKTWECLIHSSRAIKPGLELELVKGPLGRVLAREAERSIVEFESPLDNSLLEKIGKIPLPPYIMRQRESLAALDDERYQTVYSREALAAAAPTAGLHFTNEVFSKLKTRGVRLGFLTLEVGWGTFQPIRELDIRRHRMHHERFTITDELARLLSETKKAGRRVVAVGTTVVRALEAGSSIIDGQLVIEAGVRSTEIFIQPGYEFKLVDALITNFHTPRSSLLVLVSAFAGRERILDAYRVAIEAGYRFFSYGDAMLIE